MKVQAGDALPSQQVTQQQRQPSGTGVPRALQGALSTFVRSLFPRPFERRATDVMLVFADVCGYRGSPSVV